MTTIKVDQATAQLAKRVQALLMLRGNDLTLGEVVQRALQQLEAAIPPPPPAQQ